MLACERREGDDAIQTYEVNTDGGDVGLGVCVIGKT